MVDQIVTSVIKSVVTFMAHGATHAKNRQSNLDTGQLAVR